MSGRLTCAAMALTVAWFLRTATVEAQERPHRFTIWDIAIGEMATAIPDDYINYACGTDGGPPSLPLKGFADFHRCRADENGLHEVYFEYDDELEYWARALDRKPEIRMFAGTTAFEFPVVASALFDDDGRVRGLRMVTDPRQHVSRDRVEFWVLGNFLRQRFGEADWVCESLPPAEGERPVGSQFIKNHCEKMGDGERFILEQRFLQKKGQQFINPQSGKAEPQAFDSATRFDLYDAAIGSRKTGPNGPTGY